MADDLPESTIQDSEVRKRTWGGRDWSLTVTSDRVVVTQGGSPKVFVGGETAALRLRRSWFRWRLDHDGVTIATLRELARREAPKLRAAITASALDAVCAWADQVSSALDTARTDQRWITRERVDALVHTRPPSSAARALGKMVQLDRRQAAAFALLSKDLRAVVDETNEWIMAAELVSQRGFLERVERTPLTAEQARAVVCFDNRVQVVAAAGSGKTSVMVARAAYAVARGFVAPEKILLLAFNKAAAAELQERVDSRLQAVGLDVSPRLRASTFHAFGLKVIGQATGAKPRLAPWVEMGREHEVLSDIVDGLRDCSPEFRYQWDLYRLVFAGAPSNADGGDPDSYDKHTKLRGFQTLRGDLVRSHGEKMIADWLYLGGVNYEYERPYVHDVATATHSQYRPDFYYPDIEVWHEHWALDENGKPPDTAEFAGYADSMEWKRQLHRIRKTTLIESTWADVVHSDGLERLRAELESRGLTWDWNPDRPTPGARPVTHEDMVRFVRTFMAHVKSNALTREQLDERLISNPKRLGGFRAGTFLDNFWQVYEQWQERLRAENLVDFEDMLVEAAGHLETGAYDPGFELVMVDEFQDASNARARVMKALVAKPHRYLLAVGDDWQSINRFAGADMSVMTDFEGWFGAGPTVRLETTFRCPQSICDTASSFVMKNPRQLRKTVRSSQPEHGPPVTIVRTKTDGAADALATHLQQLAAEARNGDVRPGPNGRVSVKVLGRYGFDRDLMPRRIPPGLDIEYLTVHRSKGLEADYIVLPRVAAGTYGFPSGIVDDPLLDLVMAAPDPYQHSEERRLFYVALTRARRSVTIITEQGRESPFVFELINDGHSVIEGEADLRQCSGCRQGTLVARTGKYGEFLGCSRYPACNHTENI